MIVKTSGKLNKLLECLPHFQTFVAILNDFWMVFSNILIYHLINQPNFKKNLFTLNKILLLKVSVTLKTFLGATGSFRKVLKGLGHFWRYLAILKKF